MDQELIYRASMLERQSQEAEGKIDFVNQQIQELDRFQENLDIFINNKDTEMFSSLGKGVHVKANLSSKNLLVEVGAGVIVKKDAKDMKEIISSQIKKFREVKNHIYAEMEDYNAQLSEIMAQVETSKD